MSVGCSEASRGATQVTMAAGTEGANVKSRLSMEAAGAAGAPVADKLAADGEAHDLTCAICLDTIALEELSIIKGCEHAYCSAPSFQRLRQCISFGEAVCFTHVWKQSARAC